MEREDVRARGDGRAPCGAAVIARKRLPVERKHVLDGGVGLASRYTAMVAGEQQPMGRGDDWVGT